MFKLHNKKHIPSTLISIAASLLFVAHPLFAQTAQPPASPDTQGVNEQNGNNNDFDDDVKQGKDELQKDPEAQKLQKEVVDGEDEQAGDGEHNNIHEDSNLQEANNQEGVNEENKDNNNSEIDEVDDSNNLDQQSQDVINKHQQEQDQENQQGSQGEEQKGGGYQENFHSDQNQENSQPEQSQGNNPQPIEQNQPETPGINQNSSQE